MSHLFCTYCCKEKRDDTGQLPAIDRYLSERIRYVYQLALESEAEFRILSGKYGLLRGSDEIPYYDHLLRVGEVEAMTTIVSSQLKNAGVKRLRCFSAPLALEPQVKPYIEVLTSACGAERIEFEITHLESPYN